MKVYIGNYKSWFGPYQIAEKILFWKDKNDELVHTVGSWLSKNKNGNDSLTYKVCRWVNNKQNRTVKVQLHNYDTWNMDSTLAYIVVPMLKQLKETKHGAPHVEDVDVPEHLRSTVVAPVKEYETDENWFRRWDWVMDEMIFAFESKVNDNWEDQFYEGDSLKCDWDTRKVYEDRVQNGFRLFGKYYQGLWN